MATRSSAITSQVVGDGELAGRSLQYAWNPTSLAYEVVTTAGVGVGEEVKVTNTVPITAASLPLPTGAATGAKQDTGNTSLASIDTKTPALVGGRVPVDGSGVTQPVSIATNTPDVTDRVGRLLGIIASIAATVGITPPALTKGTQSANGISTQDLKDSGRVNIMWTLEFSPAAVAEALMTMTESRDGAAVTTFTTKVVTNGKRLRVTGWGMSVENTLGVNPKRAKLRMKFNTAGAVTTASPLQANLVASVATAVNTVGVEAFQEFPDGVEFLGDGTKQIGFTLEFPDWVTVAQTGKVYVTITAFEY